MTPGQQLHRILADIPKCTAEEIVTLLPYAAALQSAIFARILGLQYELSLPNIDILLNTEEIARRLGKSTKWVRDNIGNLDFGFVLGSEHRFSARFFNEWIKEHRAAKMAAALPLERKQDEG